MKRTQDVSVKNLWAWWLKSSGYNLQTPFLEGKCNGLFNPSDEDDVYVVYLWHHDVILTCKAVSCSNDCGRKSFSESLITLSSAGTATVSEVRRRRRCPAMQALLMSTIALGAMDTRTSTSLLILRLLSISAAKFLSHGRRCLHLLIQSLRGRGLRQTWKA